MSDLNDSFRVEVDVFNNTTDSILARAENTLNGGVLIQNTGEYELCVDRFNCPLTSAQVHKITDVSKYTLQLEVNNLHTAGSSNVLCYGDDNLQLTTINPIYSPSDFIEYVNRALARAHRKIIDNTTGFSSFVDTISTVGTNFTHLAGTVNLAATHAGSTTNYYVQLSLSNYVQNSVTAGEVSIINIDLSNPAGTICRVASGVILEGSKTYTFEIGGIMAQEHSGTTLDNTYSLQPVESFLKFASGTSNGNWVLTVTPAGSNTTLDIDLDITLKVYERPTVSGRYVLPHVPPNISLNSLGYIVWSFHERFLQNSYKVKLGSNLKNILSINKNIDPSSDYLKIPITLLSTAMDQVIDFTAEAAKLYQLNQLKKVLIFSNTLPVTKDRRLSNVPSFALTSFLLPGSELEQFTEVSYVFSGGNKNFRRYRMNGTNELSSFDIIIKLERKDGSVEDLYLQPEESFNALISFYKVK